MADTLENTGERYLPWSGDHITGYEHIHRYLLATRYAHEKRVLNISCGEGYGTAMLAHVATSAIGVDLDAATVAHAHAQYGGKSTHFIRADAQQFALAPGSVDLVVSFETLEHFEAHETFIAAMKTSLADDGTLMISTPNPRVYRQDEAPNSYHKRELSRDAFVALLRQHFRHVQLLGQRMIASSAIAKNRGDHFLQENQTSQFLTTEIGSTSPGYPIHAESTVEPRYYIAVCSNAPLPTIPNTVMVDNNETLYNDLIQHYADWYDLNNERFALQAEIQYAQTRAYRARTMLGRQRGRLLAARMALATTRAQLHDSQTTLTEARAQFEATQETLTGARLQLEATQSTLANTQSTLTNAQGQAARAQRRLARMLTIASDHSDRARTALGDHAPRVLVVIPGSLNYFYNQAGRRIASALRTLGFSVTIETLRAAPFPEYDWCFLVNPYELVVSYGDEQAGFEEVKRINECCRQTVAVLLECAQTNWFQYSYDICHGAGIATLLDLGFHDQSALLPDGPPRYQFAFNGLTEDERARVYDRPPPANDHAVPWVFIGHLSHMRTQIVSRLLHQFDPHGLVYLPYLSPVTEDGPHINEQQLDTILRHAQYQIWCAHHDYFYMESERFRNSLLTGSLPIKVMLHPRDDTRAIPFPYLLIEEGELGTTLDQLDFAATQERFVEEFRALPTLEESLMEALLAIGVRREVAWTR